MDLFQRIITLSLKLLKMIDKAKTIIFSGSGKPLEKEANKLISKFYKLLHFHIFHHHLY